MDFTTHADHLKKNKNLQPLLLLCCNGHTRIYKNLMTEVYCRYIFVISPICCRRQAASLTASLSASQLTATKVYVSLVFVS